MVRVVPLILIALLAVGQAEADAQTRFGAQAALWDFEEVGLGVRADFGLGETFGIEGGVFQQLFATTNVNFVLADVDGTPLLINANAAVPFHRDGAATPYAGAGINHFRYSGFSASGLNLLGGLLFDLGTVPAFAELQYSTTGTGALTLSTGLFLGGSTPASEQR